MFTQSRISVDDNIAEEVVKLYRDPKHARGHRYGTWHSPRIRSNPYPWFESTFNRVAAASNLTIDEWWFNCGAPGTNIVGIYTVLIRGLAFCTYKHQRIVVG
jgi:hypothetical protein